MKIKLQIKNRWYGSLIFEYESENNTIAITLKEAIKRGADLRGADLSSADLSSADLSSADLRGAYLSGADLRGADLRGADLSSADLRGAYLRGAYLSSADLSGADLRGAYLSGADLRGAYLRGADLSSADLRGADLSGADLRGAYVSGADLSSADLRGADLSGADLSGADLRGALNSEMAIATTRICAEGNIIGYKKALTLAGDYVIVELLIPAEAKRNNAFGRKCRAEYAQVVEIKSADETINYTSAISQHDNSFQYSVGDVIKPTQPFNEDFINECSTGIHFFITRLEAINY